MLRFGRPEIARVTFPGAVPEIAVDPGDPRDETLVLDRPSIEPVAGSIRWIWRPRCCPTRSVPSAGVSSEAAPPLPGLVSAE